jgi:hypothetical protein
MYYIIDLETNPPQEVPNLSFETENQACDWINQNGNAIIYSIIEKSE